jgi:sec-independent protein translocase protein TatA
MFRNPTTDLIIVLVIVLLIFGPKRLPGLGRALGGGLREFKDSITGDSKSDEESERSGLPAGDAAPSQPRSSGSPTEAAPPPASSTVPAAGSPESSPERRS